MSKNYPSLKKQIIIVCDLEGKPTGEYVPKAEGITGNGKHHLAITVLLQNKAGKVLLQKRKHLVFDNLWDLTASTDVSHFEDGRNETFNEATARCLKREFNIDYVENLKNLGGFNYFAKDGEYCENEYCAMMVGEFSGEFELNPEVGYEYKWMDKKEFLLDLESNPQNYTPWAIEAAKLLRTQDWSL